MKQFKILLISLLLSTSCFAETDYQASMQAIPPEIKQQMINHTWHAGCPMLQDNLSYLTVTYWGFDAKPHEGHIIVLKLLALETLQIFQDLYQLKFPIERMVLPDFYKTDDESAADNNTYGFFCRPDGQNPTKFSPHSYGVAIDINPFYNPALIAGGKVQPEKGKAFLDRKKQHIGMVNDAVVRVFAKYGWKWGGYWTKDLDYMHFEKDIDDHYTCNSMEFSPKK